MSIHTNGYWIGMNVEGQHAYDENLSDASYNFYNYLNILDSINCSGIAVAPIPDEGLGKTINDRLKRASYKDE